MPRTSLLAALSVMAMACGGAAPSASTTPSVAEIPIEPPAPLYPGLREIVRAATSDAPVPRSAMSPTPVSSGDAAEDATRERRVYRDLVTGALPRYTTRLTWILSRGATRARMQLVCQSSTEDGFPRRLTGAENDEDGWSAPELSDYDGRLDGALSYLFTRSSPGSAEGSQPTLCGAAPKAFRLQCHTKTVSVLRAGAALIPGTGAKDVDVPIAARWDPPKLERVEALSCDVRGADAPASPEKGRRDVPDEERASLERGAFFALSPVFAAATPARPGIEWAYENSDCLVQTGAYRFLSRAR